MKPILAVFAALLTALLTLPANGNAQTPQKSVIFTVAGHAGEAQLLVVNGKSYVEVETLARLTQGTLSFKANQTTLTLSPSDAAAPAPTPHARAGFSRTFVQAGVEEMGLIREWRIAVVNAIQNNTPASEDWLSTQHGLAAKNLALASAASATDDDRSAYPLLSAEYGNMEKLSDLYLAVRKQAAFISPDTFGNSALEQQILSCARSYISMTESHEFEDQSACH